MRTRCIYKCQLYVADVGGCPLRRKDAAGIPIPKQWRFPARCERQAVSLSAPRCSHQKDSCHGAIEGVETKKTESYPESLCCVLSTWLLRAMLLPPCHAVLRRKQLIKITCSMSLLFSVLPRLHNQWDLHCYADHPKLPAMVAKLQRLRVFTQRARHSMCQRVADAQISSTPMRSTIGVIC